MSLGHQVTAGETVIAVILAALLGFGGGVAIAGHTHETVADFFPCPEGTVGVWTSYPDKFACMDDTDHAGHQGG